MDWYRYGSIRIPRHVSLAMMQRECAYFQLPEDARVARECPQLAEAVQTVEDAKAEVFDSMVAFT
eukprot:2347074-Amphidinium_carterae.1